VSLRFAIISASEVSARLAIQKGSTILTEIRRRRLDRKLTQIQLADLVGIGQPALVNWEYGRNQPVRADVRRKLEAILGAPIHVLMENENGAVPKDNRYA
jgi:transcriptional regulator with XRE-family HTH domain